MAKPVKMPIGHARSRPNSINPTLKKPCHDGHHQQLSAQVLAQNGMSASLNESG
jgi:hypothetical protein